MPHENTEGETRSRPRTASTHYTPHTTENNVPRCARLGCPNPQSHPDQLGLGFCDTHNHQFKNGTLGQGHNPRSKETPITIARELIDKTRHPGEKDRALARRLGIPKDTIHHVMKETWPVLRSATWEALAEACADQLYLDEQRRPKQLSLFDIPAA